MPKFFHRAYFALLYALPAVLFFSYHPIISLGASDSMNFELSLPLIWLVLFDFVFAYLAISNKTIRHSVKSFFEGIRGPAPHSSLGKNTLNLTLLLFPIYATLSILWSANPTRAFLTAGIIWLLFFAILAIIFLTPRLNPPSRLKIRLLGVFFVSTAVICLFCFIQSLLDSCGLSRESTLLCAGCTYRSFGFPHPNGFAIEPQFMGNLLLAPTLLALYLLCRPASVKALKTEQITKTEHTKPEQPAQTFPHLRKTSAQIALVIFTVLFSTTLFFTFSRGAIYSYAIALAILIIFALVRHTFRPALIIIPVTTFLFSLGLQGAFAHFGPTSETFTSAITKSIHQLSLGLIDLRPTSDNQADAALGTTTDDGVSKDAEGASGQAEPGQNATPSGEHSERLTAPSTALETPIFNGYVADSTNVRLNLSSAALATWCQSPLTALFGVGLGGAGIAMHRFDPATSPSPKEIVQNQPISLLLETGLVGIALILLGLYAAFRPQNRVFWSHPALPLLLALFAAYLVSMQFFAGLPNALQIYLIPPLLYYLFLPSPQTPSASPSRQPKPHRKSHHQK